MCRLRITHFSLAVSLILTSLFLQGCVSVLTNNSFRKSKTAYTIGDLPQGWRKVSLRGADLAYVHDKSGSTLLVNSKCENPEDAPLVALTYHLLIGMTDQNIIEQKTVPCSGREGLQTIAEAKLDGVKRKFKMFVLKKDYCIYDIVLATPPELFDEMSVAFDSMFKGFSVGEAKL